MATAEAIVGELVTRRAAQPQSTTDLFDEIIARWSDDEEHRVIGIARDVVLVHIASMSNLFAAMGWMLVDLIEHPALLETVRNGDAELAERCALRASGRRAAYYAETATGEVR